MPIYMSRENGQILKSNVILNLNWPWKLNRTVLNDVGKYAIRSRKLIQLIAMFKDIAKSCFSLRFQFETASDSKI
jgi:hypothetical protein